MEKESRGCRFKWSFRRIEKEILFGSCTDQRFHVKILNVMKVFVFGDKEFKFIPTSLNGT